MSDAVIFDQLSFIKRGVDAGVPREHAEWLAKEQLQLLETNLATKTDIKGLQAATAKDIEGLRKDTTVAIAQLEAKLVRWLFGALIGQGGLIVALVKLL